MGYTGNLILRQVSNNKLKQIPKRLKIEPLPLIEATWEIRFSSKINSLAEILPGIIYTKFKEQYEKVVKLPHAELPPSVFKHDPNLRYMPIVRLEGSQYAIQIGEYVVSLSCHRPYSGWSKFGEQIEKLASELQETHLLTEPERFSLKYIDIIETTKAQDLSVLDVKFMLGGKDLNKSPLHLRTEIHGEPYVHVIQIASPTEVTLPSGEKFNGVLLDIETIYLTNSTKNFWSGFQNKLNEAHDASKKEFFELLDKDTITSLKPEY